MKRISAYKVLWVEDDPNFRDAFLNNAQINGIEMAHFEDWESASPYLNQYIDEIDAVILDAHCKIKKGESAGNDDFLHIAVVDMLLIFSKHHTIRPWFVLSAGTMDRFTNVTSVIDSYRKEYVPEWGEMVYSKTKPRVFSSEFSDEFGNGDSQNSTEQDLLNKIKEVCSSDINNSALSRHRDTLKYLGSESIFKGNARKLMLQLLSALYSPQKYIGFTFAGNPIRRIFECIVRACVEFGVIPDEVIKGGNVKCMEASRFLCGENPLELPYRFGNSSDRILYVQESSMLITILTSTNVASHESADDYDEANVEIKEDNRDEFSGCALLMCRIIKAIGKYLETHDDPDENRKLWQRNPKPIEGKECEIKFEGGLLFAGDCLLPDKDWLKPGNKVILYDVVINKQETANILPFYSKSPKSPRVKR